MTEQEKARVLIADITEALARGTLHFAEDGRPLLTVRDVLVELRATGRVELRPRIDS